jgi:hypothetical protein
MMGVLPEPKGYSTIWPDLESLSDMDQAEIAVKRTGALAQFVQSGSESAMSLADFFTRILNMGIEEARSIIEAVEKRIKEEDSGGSPLLSMTSGITGMVELFKLYSAGGMTRETLKQQIMLFFKVDEAKAEAIISKEDLKKATQPPQAIPGNPNPTPKVSSEPEDEVDDTEEEVPVEDEEEEEVANQASISNKKGDGWVTIGGQHVLIKGGKMVNPPAWSEAEGKPPEKPASSKEPEPPKSEGPKSASPKSSSKSPTSYKSGDEAEKDLAPSKSQWAETSGDYFANKAVKAYAGTSDSFLINNCLRSNCKEKSLKDKAKALAAVLDKTSFPKDITAHRAVNAKTPQEREAILSQFASNVGKTVVDNAFVSTTANKKYAATWGKNSKVEPIQVEVLVPKGAKAAYLPKDVVGKQEWEVLIQRGSKYKVSSVSGSKVTLEYVG